jgi:hypothetical protein
MDRCESSARAGLLGLAATVGVAVLSAANPAAASIYMSTSGGGSCHAAGAGSTSVRYTNTYAENIGTTDQYLVCALTNWDVGHDINDIDKAQSPEQLRVFVSAGAYAGTATCAAQMAGWYGTSVHVASSASRNLTLAAGTGASVVYYAADLPRTWEYDTLVLNCKLPRGFKLGSIDRWEPEPRSGQAWTP